MRGIVNGTTNYILTAMAEDGRPYDDVLVDAQELGYAEADPSGDVEGDDAVNKLVILARLAFGRWLDPSSVGRRPPTARGTGRPGITGVTDQEIEGAAALGLTLKLLATATRRDDAIEAAVIPTAVPSDSPFGWTDGVTNRVEIEAEPLGVGPPRRARRRRRGDEQRRARRPRRGRARPGLDVGRAATGGRRRGRGGRSARRAATLVRVRAIGAWRPTCRPSSSTPRRSGSRTAPRSGPRSRRSTRRRRRSTPMLPDGVDVTLYPVDD